MPPILRLRLGALLRGVLPERLLAWLVRVNHGEVRTLRTAAGVGRRMRWWHGLPDGYVAADVGPIGRPARVVSGFDAREVRSETLGLVAAALRRCGIEYVLVPSLPGGRPRIAIAMEDRRAAMECLRQSTGPEWFAEPAERGPRRQPRPRWWLTLPVPPWVGRARGVRLARMLATADGVPLPKAGLACALDFWARIDMVGVERPDGGEHAEGTRISPFPRSTSVSYLSPATWSVATQSPDHWPSHAGRPWLFQVRAPVDIVYTWVDGGEPLWQQRRDRYLDRSQCSPLPLSAFHSARYACHDELRYSLRSVAMFASWVRHIYIVTDQQVPVWLDTAHPKITVVDHREIFTDPSVLPVFNSHAIESQLHHIPGLSEQYIYLNDDVFFGRPVEPELFFDGNGLSRFFLSNARLDLDAVLPHDLPVMSAAKRNRELIEQHFDATVINKMKHTPHPQLRDVLEEMELKHPGVFARVAAARFRSPEDLSLAASLHHYYAYQLRRSVPGTIRYGYLTIDRPDAPRGLANLLRNRSFDTFCLNDHESDPARYLEVRSLLGTFLQAYFPLPSPFEHPTPAAMELTRRHDLSAHH